MTTAACAGCGRANPRIAHIAYAADTGTGTATFHYDDRAQLVSVDKVLDVGDVLTQTLTWENGTIVGLHTAQGQGNLASSSDQSQLQYQDGRLVLASSDTGSSTYAYDDAQRLALFTNTRDAAGTDVEERFKFSYDEAGALSRLVFTQTAARTATAAYAFERDDGGKLLVLDATLDAGHSTLTATYDADDRLKKLISTDVYEDNPAANQNNTTTYAYGDDGMLQHAVRRGTDGDADITLSYEDGDAVAVDVTSNALYPLFLWDMQGRSFDRYTDAQSPRFLMEAW